MTQQSKANILIFTPYLAFLPVVYLLFSWGQFTERNDSRMFKDAEEKNEIISHAKKGTDAYLNVHMDKSEKDRVYVLKSEFQDVKEDVKETKDAVLVIQKDIKQILRNQ